MDPLTLALLGSLGGAFANRKDPLKGAVLGGALGFGGSMIPGLLSAGGGTGAAVADQTALGVAQHAMTGGLSPDVAARMAGMNPSAIPALSSGAFTGGAGAQTAAQMGMSPWGKLGGLLETGGNAAKSAAAVKSLMPQNPPAPPPPVGAPQGNNPMANFYNTIQQRRQAEATAMQEQRMRRMQQMARMGQPLIG